ncbi:MFS transporter, partial [Candidatus Bathyarchaeota archaeon]|nr:MFS transporter [Candidatus Bathyarchaeota archaeon]
MFFDVAYQSYLPSLVDRADLVEGNAKLEVSQSAAQVAGRALAGFLIRVIGAAKAIAVDAGAFLTSAVVL